MSFHVHVPVCIRTCIFAEQSLYKGTFTVGVSFFGQRVKVFFDDKKEYMGVICGRDMQTDEWITKFEDGTEDRVTDPAADEDYTLL